jgi:single-stranded DNA-binding protein
VIPVARQQSAGFTTPKSVYVLEGNAHKIHNRLPRWQAPSIASDDSKEQFVKGILMSIMATVRGNLTKAPVSKTVKVAGENRRIVEIRVFSDEYRGQGDDRVQDDEKCIGIDVTIWSEKLGEQILKHLGKGARVEVKGALVPHRYRDLETQEPRLALQMTGESVTLALNRVANIEFDAPRGRSEPDDDTPF